MSCLDEIRAKLEAIAKESREKMNAERSFLEVRGDDPKAKALEKWLNHQIATDPRYRAAFESDVAKAEAKVVARLLYGRTSDE